MTTSIRRLATTTVAVRARYHDDDDDDDDVDDIVTGILGAAHILDVGVDEWRRRGRPRAATDSTCSPKPYINPTSTYYTNPNTHTTTSHKPIRSPMVVRIPYTTTHTSHIALT